MFAKGIPLPVGHIVCFRSLLAAVLLLSLLLAARAPMKMKSTSDYGMMIVLGILLCLHWLTLYRALRISTAAVATLSLSTYLVFTTFVEPLVFREKLRMVDVTLVVAVVAGVLIMIPQISLSNTTTQAILLGIVSGLFFMVRNLVTRKYVQKYSSSLIMFWQMLVTGALLAPLVLLSEKVVYSPQTVGLLVLFGTVFTALPQTLFAASFKNLSVTAVSIITTLHVFYGALLGYIIHGETVTPRTAIGGVLVLTCVIVETIRKWADTSPPSARRN
jgi:drug/metabolite transporter (DMT)-like permease